MSANEESGDSDSGKNKMLKRPLENKFSNILPVDAENYMLRGIGRPANKTVVSAEGATSDGEMNHQGATATANTIQNFKIRDKEAFWGWGTTTSEDGGECCARILSFHNLLCSCEMSCCCKCGTLCSADCHACFHNYCLRYFPHYMCQKDTDSLPPVTLDYDKVGL